MNTLIVFSKKDCPKCSAMESFLMSKGNSSITSKYRISYVDIEEGGSDYFPIETHNIKSVPAYAVINKEREVLSVLKENVSNKTLSALLQKHQI